MVVVDICCAQNDWQCRFSADKDISACVRVYCAVLGQDGRSLRQCCRHLMRLHWIALVGCALKVLHMVACANEEVSFVRPSITQMVFHGSVGFGRAL